MQPSSAGPFSLSCQDAVRRIRAHDREVHAFVSTRLDDALRDAEASAAGAPRSELHGVPFGLKDEFDTCCLPTTGGSWRHRDRRPDKDGSVYRAFAEAGAILLGKTNLSDMGLAPEASSHVGGSTLNPFDRRRTAGGSSGGSAASVAFGFTGFDWGTDIGGSIRLPAAFCGVLGLRLSHATWPIQDLFPSVPPAMDWLCGQGPFTRTTAQMRAVLDTAAPRLRIGQARPFALRGALLYRPDVGAWPTFASDVESHVREAVGGHVAATDALAPPRDMREIYAAVWASHFGDLLAADPSISLADGVTAALIALLLRGALDRRFHPTTAELLLLIALGSFVFRDRERARARALGVRSAFEDLWGDGLIVAAPVTAFPPPKVGRSNWVPHLISCTVIGNLSDATGLTVPYGTFDGRLPRAIQLLGPPGSERVLLDVADRLIAARDRAPSLRQPPTWLDG